MNNQSPERKVAILTLGRRGQHDAPLHNKSSTTRVRKACDNCRKRKVKCTGEQPHCQRCSYLEMPCIYPHARRDRLKEAREEKTRFIIFLKNLTAHVDNTGKEKIENFLDTLRNDSPTTAPARALQGLETESREDPASNKGGGRDNPCLGETEQESRFTSIGEEGSEVHWLQGVGEPNILVEDKASRDGGYLSHSCPTLVPTISHNVQDIGKIGDPCSNCTATANLGSHRSSRFGQQQPVQAYGEIRTPHVIKSEPGVQMSQSLGNCFVPTPDRLDLGMNLYV